jgi:hypothetical protein
MQVCDNLQELRQDKNGFTASTKQVPVIEEKCFPAISCCYLYRQRMKSPRSERQAGRCEKWKRE